LTSLPELISRSKDRWNVAPTAMNSKSRFFMNKSCDKLMGCCRSRDGGTCA
jgi:hypothetical protein